MRYGKLICILAAVVLAAFHPYDASAQFKEEAFQQTYNDDTADADSVDTMFSLKQYMRGLGHKEELKIGTMFAGSTVFVGGSQIYNKDYWKLPIAYGAIGGSLGAGFYFNSQGDKETAKYCWIGAGVAYWATLMDGVVSYQPADYPHAGKATLYSILLPGLGQIYNHEYWKLPIYLGGMAASVYYYSQFRMNYNRFRSIYLEATEEGSTYDGPITADQAKYYRDVYRRYRDYSVLAIGLVYLLQVLDANVFTYMHNFEVDDDLALKVTPTVIVPDMQLAASSSFKSGTGIGLRMGFTF